MRKYAYLKEPLKQDGKEIFKVMLCEAKEGVYLFEYTAPDAVLCSADLCYASPDEVYDDWNGLIDENGWILLEAPLPGCQQDAFLPVRVKGRDTGKPEWGSYEMLKDGEWVEYRLTQ